MPVDVLSILVLSNLLARTQRALESHSADTTVSSSPETSIATGFILPGLTLLMWVAESEIVVSTCS
jgi:hypothetical protein